MKTIKKYIKRFGKAYIKSVNEFYKPLVDAKVPIIL